MPTASSRRSSAASAGATDYEGFGDVDFVIEAVPERMEIKQSVFAELDALTPGHAILASNTSSLSITEMAEATTRPDKVCGFHFFYPASMMRLIEVIEGEETSRGDAPGRGQLRPGDPQDARSAAARCPGFVVNRILNSAVSEVWRVTEEEGLDVEEVDRIDQGVGRASRWARSSSPTCSGSTPSCTWPSTCTSSYGDRFYVSAQMKELVDAGNLGQKTGKGFYEHGG